MTSVLRQPTDFTGGQVSSGDGGWDAVSNLSVDAKRTLLFGAAEPVRASQNSYGADEAFAVTNRTRSWSYIGQNEVINMNIIRTIRAKENYMLEVVFKLRALPAGNKVKVVELRYDDALLNPVPEQGTGRLTMQSMRSWVMGVPRKGLAFMMEDGLAMTDVGVEQYRNNIIQLANATIDSLTLDSYYRCLTAHNSGDYYKQFGMNKQRSTRSEITEQERYQWSLLSKIKYGFFKMRSECRRVLLSRRVDGDTLLLPSGTREYLRLNRPETQLYSSFGERGPSQMLSEGSNYVFRMDGVDIYESSLYNVTETQEAQDPMTRVRTIGEFADCLLEDNMPSEGMMKFYDSSLRTIVIHDNRSDTMTPITFKQMMDKSGLFEKFAMGRPTDHMGRPYFERHQNIDSWYTETKMRDHLLNALKAKFDNDPKKATDALKIKDAVNISKRRTAPAGSGGAAGKSTEAKRMGGGATRKQITIFKSTEESLKDTDDLKTTAAKKAALAELSKENGALGPKVGSNQEDLSPIFAELAETRALTTAQVQTLANNLSEELNQANYETVKKKPYVRYLRRYFHNTQVQEDLYSSAGDPSSVREFLTLLFPRSVADAVSKTTSSYETTVSRMTDARRGDAAMGVAPPAAMGDEDIQGAAKVRRYEQMQELIQNMRSRFRNAYPDADAIAPGILGAFFGYLVLGGKTKAEEAKRRVDLIGMTMDDMSIRLKQSKRTRTTTQRDIDGSLESQYDQIFDGIVRIQNAAGVNTLYSAFEADDIASAKEPLSPDELAVYTGIAAPGKAPASEAGDAWDTLLRDLPICGAVFNRLYEKGLPIAIDFNLARPHMTYEMGSAIFLKRGPETGATFLGAADFQIANETNRKVLMGFFTCETGCLIWRPDNLHVMHNIVCRRYMGGGGVGMWDNGDENDRQNFMSGKNPNRNSIFVIPMVPGERIKNGEFDITGEFAQDQAIPAEHGGGHAVGVDPHYAMAAPFMRHWGFVHRDDPFDIGYFVDENRLNTVLYRMTSFHAQLTESGRVIKRGYYKAGCGHWGRYVYDGVREGRLGGGDDGYVITDSVAVFRNADPISCN